MGRVGLRAFAAACLLVSAACGAEPGPVPQRTGPAALQVLIGSSGAAETKAVTDAAAAWSAASGNSVTVIPAQDLDQQLGQAFAGSSPPDVFYVDAARFADFASVGALEPYAEALPAAGEFYGTLRQAFTYQGRFYCAPKDFATLALQVNEELWARAGLTAADVPRDWTQLTAVAERIAAKGITPLVVGDTVERIGAFLVQAGGWLISPDGARATADSPENLTALQYVQQLLRARLARYPSALDTGWAGEAFGRGLAAMTIEGNWIKGALAGDYPGVRYTVHELPAGPAGEGTLSFTTCWGISARTPYRAQAVAFVEAMTAVDQQLAFASAYGVMPSVTTARDRYLQAFPADRAFLDSADHAQGPVNAPKMGNVLSDFDTQLQRLAVADPQAILRRLQRNMTAALRG
ncbi:sugar ABC transporter substrate-binding protein [Catellatospora sichuanensis]|uniref:sugar ABC transporter substrate-binding protein n=1 Tax=Catellatospora sichuanensis TaxID=1969805 RepID=UPI0011826BFA|nr:extracellular solute-binding protein [Catellatospora sichuanensis]